MLVFVASNSQQRRSDEDHWLVSIGYRRNFGVDRAGSKEKYKSVLN
jgi:hypothetical protein